MPAGPIPFQDSIGRELVTQYNTSWDTKATWWSDANGRDSMTRVRNFRKSFNFTPEAGVEPVSSNYYPTNLFIYTQVCS